jgi:hypothetical protein
VCRPGRTLVGVVAQPVGAAVGAAHALCLGGVEVTLADHPGGQVAGELQRGGGGRELHQQGGSGSLEAHDAICSFLHRFRECFRADTRSVARVLALDQDALCLQEPLGVTPVALASPARPRHGRQPSSLGRRALRFERRGAYAGASGWGRLAAAFPRREQSARLGSALRSLPPRASWERPRRGHADFRFARAMRKRATKQSERSDVVPRERERRPRGDDRLRVRLSHNPLDGCFVGATSNGQANRRDVPPGNGACPWPAGASGTRGGAGPPLR